MNTELGREIAEYVTQNLLHSSLSFNYQQRFGLLSYIYCIPTQLFRCVTENINCMQCKICLGMYMNKMLQDSKAILHMSSNWFSKCLGFTPSFHEFALARLCLLERERELYRKLIISVYLTILT